MQALYYDGHAPIYRTDCPTPTPTATESLVRILLAAVCNTDKEITRGYKPDFTGVMGHEFVGVVERSPDASLIGKRVVGELNAGCGTCLYCRSGRQSHCDHRRVIGITDKDGCFADYMTIETALLHPVPDEVSTGKAVFTEPLAAALEIVEQAHIMPSQNVAVLGDGRLAYMIAQVVSLLGVDLTVVGRHPEKLVAFALFAKTTQSPTETFEVVIDATGSPTGVVTAQELVRRRGTIVMKSTYAGNVSLNMSGFVVNEITLKGSRCGPFLPALQLLRRGLITLPEVEVHPLCDFAAAFGSPAFKAGFLF